MKLVIRWSLGLVSDLLVNLRATFLPPPISFVEASSEAANRGAWHDRLLTVGLPPGKIEPNGKVALVTGGSRGIGREVCLGLCARGWDVTFTGRDQAAGFTMQDEIRKEGGVASFVPLNLHYNDASNLTASQTASLWADEHFPIGQPLHLLVDQNMNSA